MGTAIFDTLKLFEKFGKAGLSEPLSRLFADLFAKIPMPQNLATKSDVVHDLQMLEARIDHKFEQMRVEISHVKFDLIKWLIGMSCVLASLIIGLKVFG